MIAPEPTKVRLDVHWQYPSDEGRQDRWLYSITETPEIGAAGHLGVIEMLCPGPHAEESVLVWDMLPCKHCGADGTDMPPDVWGVMVDRAPIAKRDVEPAVKGEPIGTIDLRYRVE